VLVGIGYPCDKALVQDFVERLSKAEASWVEAVCRVVANAVPLLVAGRDAFSE
jgi:peptidyl-tRNA hydrolase